MSEPDIMRAIDILWDSIEANPNAEACKESLVSAIAYLMEAVQEKNKRPLELTFPNGKVVHMRAGINITYAGYKHLVKKRWASRTCGRDFQKFHPRWITSKCLDRDLADDSDVDQENVDQENVDQDCVNDADSNANGILVDESKNDAR